MKEKEINPLIREQLENCRATDLSKLDTETYTLYIPQIKTIKLEENKSYVVKIDKSCMISSMFNSNWNVGKPPISEYLLVDVVKITSQTIKVNGIEYNIETETPGTKIWSGWLLTQCVEVLRKA